MPLHADCDQSLMLRACFFVTFPFYAPPHLASDARKSKGMQGDAGCNARGVHADARRGMTQLVGRGCSLDIHCAVNDIFGDVEP